MDDFWEYQDALNTLLKPFPEHWRAAYDEEWPTQKFEDPDRVCWTAQTPDGEVIDHGTVRGFGLLPAEHLGRLDWRYLIDVDEDSPSYDRARHVLRWQDDLFLNS
jgi:hypothetical protein